jgi:hypothetical protein
LLEQIEVKSSSLETIKGQSPDIVQGHGHSPGKQTAASSPQPPKKSINLIEVPDKPDGTNMVTPQMEIEEEMAQLKSSMLLLSM